MRILAVVLTTALVAGCGSAAGGDSSVKLGFAVATTREDFAQQMADGRGPDPARTPPCHGDRGGLMTVAVVTGAANGLGQTFAVALSKARYRVAGLDIADLAETEALVDEAGGELLAVRCDVRDPESVDTAVNEVAREFGALHVVVNNAGIYPPIPFEQTTLSTTGTGSCGSITVNAIAPGLVRTATAASTTGANGGFERVRELQCVPRVEEPEDVVSTLLYVCDRGSGFLTGQTINVDGGSAKH